MPDNQSNHLKGLTGCARYPIKSFERVDGLFQITNEIMKMLIGCARYPIKSFERVDGLCQITNQIKICKTAVPPVSAVFGLV